MFLEELSTKRERTRVFIRSHNVEGQIEVDQSLEKKKNLKIVEKKMKHGINQRTNLDKSWTIIQ